MPSPANIRETIIAWGFNKQSDIATKNADAGLWRMNKLNAALANPKLTIEDDAQEIGKGHEFATQTFQTAWDISGQLEKYNSSDFAAWAMVFGLGGVAETGTTPNFIYTCTPLDPVAGGIELPYFSFIETIRQGGSAVLDRAAVGCAVEGWTLTVTSGPGRANSKLVVDFVGSGMLTQPSGSTLPSPITEKLLPGASVAVSINGVDYVSNKNIVSLEATWKNNLRLPDGFFPGSGFQTPGDTTTGAIRGRLEHGDRAATLKFTARFENGSTELTKLLAQTSGTAVLTLTHDAHNSLQITWQKITFSVAEVNDTSGLVTVAVECDIIYDPTNGLITAVAACNTDGIGAVTP